VIGAGPSSFPDGDLGPAWIRFRKSGVLRSGESPALQISQAGPDHDLRMLLFEGKCNYLSEGL
jgi:hypothetical protein